MIVRAAAKLNLMLDMVKKLDNGYHSLFMVMQSVDLYDTVDVQRNGLGKILIESDSADMPKDSSNIAYKCAEKFFDAMEISQRGITIRIGKNIPMAAGIAGGSADGAAVLYCLNKMYGTKLSRTELCEIGAKVGADIPFSLTGGTAVVLNTGDVIAPVKPLSDCKIIIVKPEQDVSTKEAYAMLDSVSRLRHLDRAGMLEAVSKGDYEAICSRCGNVFEQAVEVPERPYIKNIMRKNGADACLMSGSGPTVFGLFSDTEKAEKCFDELKMNYKNVFRCSPISEGIIEI